MRASFIRSAPNKGTVLWLGGWSMPDAVFESLRAALPEYRHLSVDLGRANSAAEMLLLAEQAARSAWDGFRKNSPLLVAGWSLGGLLALRLAELGLADGLVLLAATARFTRPKQESELGWRDIYIRRMRDGLVRDRETVEANFRELLFSEQEKQALPGKREHLPPAGSWSNKALAAGLELLQLENCLPRLGDIRLPALLVHGTADRICPYGAALELNAGLPFAKLITIDGGGHAPFLGSETQLADEIRRWRHEWQHQ
ncbi:alpha/beta hydrolase [Paenibacillus pasadenensis]|uniref:alpha/beta hydrolase n=1 Tax=Paenibacillus pasadenensis TaxID=217090 RepID=UPI00203EC712|nr:alpha/beta fold hydrolase [Paenibacillus pasadenensis]MCM3748002.1 alpha/beta hydrolase [Paenibacillus pasadenensis]